MAILANLLPILAQLGHVSFCHIITAIGIYIFSKPIFDQASMKMFEGGGYQHLSTFYFGTKQIKANQRKMDTLVISHGQVLLIFAVLSGAIFLGLTILILEIAVHKIHVNLNK